MLTLQDAANYIRTARAPAGLLALLRRGLGKVFTFKQEHENRPRRYVVVTRAYKAGKPVGEIINEFGCSANTVNRYARMADLPKRPKHFPREIRTAVIRDYKAKLPVERIAELHSVSPAYVSKVAREEGISRYEPRPKLKRSSAQ